MNTGIMVRIFKFQIVGSAGVLVQMVSLAFMRGLTHQEISDTLQQPLGTVKTTIRRALQSMRGIIEQQAPQLARQYSPQTMSALLTPQENDYESPP